VLLLISLADLSYEEVGGGARHCRSAASVTALPHGQDAPQHYLGHGGGVNWLAGEVSKRAGAEQRINHGAGVMRA
jgi:hypothetical protein